MQNYLPACKIVSTHGVRGEMKALPLCDGAQFLAKFKRLYAAANGSGEVALRGVRAQGNMLLIKLAGVEDMGRVIGKQGRIAKAIRVVMRAAAVRQNEKAVVEIG